MLQDSTPRRPELSDPYLTSEEAGLPQQPVSIASFLRIFSAVMLPMFLAAADQTLLATATPSIAADLGGLRDTTWVSVGYLIAMTATVPLYGRLGDRYGRRDTLLAALVVFCAGSAACGLANSLGMLVAARVLQGLGGGGLMVMAQSLIGELVPPRERARFQAYFATNFTLANVGGPLIGGLVVHHASWRWLFLVNLPLCAIAGWRLLRLPRGTGNRQVMPADPLGALAFASAVTASLIWASFAGYRFAWTSGTSLILAVGSLLLWGVLITREFHESNPFLPIELLRERSMRYLCLTVVSFAACLFALIFFLPVLIQVGHGADARRAGVLLLPLTLGIVTGSTLTGRIVSRTGRPTPMPIIGLSISCAALILMCLLTPRSELIAALGAVCGFGFGTVMPTAQIISQTLAGRDRLGAAASVVSLARYTGAALGTAVFGAVVFALAPDSTARIDPHTLSPATSAQLSRAIRIGFGALAAVAAAGAWFASRIQRIRL
jgi:EmrB/QacA subfamily drug resistance transporter